MEVANDRRGLSPAPAPNPLSLECFGVLSQHKLPTRQGDLAFIQEGTRSLGNTHL